MSIIIVREGVRDNQFTFIFVDDGDTYRFTRTHCQPISTSAAQLLEYAEKMGNPPILIDVGPFGALLLSALRNNNYPRLVKMGRSERSKEGWHE